MAGVNRTIVVIALLAMTAMLNRRSRGVDRTTSKMG